MSEKNTDFSDLMDVSLDDLADLPEFKPYPAGVHIADLEWERKEINSKPSIIMNFKYVECVELSDTSEKVPEPGATAQVAFILKNNDGQKNEISEGKWKNVCTELQPAFGGNSIGEIMANSQGGRVQIATKVKVNKQNGTENMDIITIAGV